MCMYKLVTGLAAVLTVVAGVDTVVKAELNPRSFNGRSSRHASARLGLRAGATLWMPLGGTNGEADHYS